MRHFDRTNFNGVAHPAGRKPADSTRVILATFAGVLIGFVIGVSFPTFTINGFNLSSGILPTSDEVPTIGVLSQPPLSSLPSRNNSNISSSSDVYRSNDMPQDLTIQQKYLVTFTVGYNQRNSIDAAFKKFSENFTIVLFHYDGRATEWDEFEWSKRAIHVNAPKQTKWWYAKRFFHPDIVVPYDYLFIWDENLGGVEHFDAEEYIKLVKKHGLEISQSNRITWKMTQRRHDKEVHKCSDKRLPPRAAFIEIMAPVFSIDAWRCVWHMLQNDLVHVYNVKACKLQKRMISPQHKLIEKGHSVWLLR